VSRTPVREALFTLQSEGLVDLTPNRGATVRSITAHNIGQVYALRGVLESYAAREAALNRERHHLDALEDAHARLERTSAEGTAAEQSLADLAFHTLVTEATGSQLLKTIMGQVFAFTVSYRSNLAYPSDRAATVNAQHRAILDALRDGDADRAERLMGEHVASSSSFAVEHFADVDRAHPR
jgi:DNA-binding GntR family transcriptional regulator